MRARTKIALSLGGAALAASFLSRRGRWRGFTGRVVLVTGGSRGLGLELAREFARRGARVAICARDPRELEAARVDLERRGADVAAFTCDVGDPVEVQGLVRAVEERFGGLDVLVNNAGAIQVGPLGAATIEDFEAAMKVHYWGPLYATLAALPGLLRRGEGRILNIASIGGKVSLPHLLPYNASKFALVGLSEGLRGELAGRGILVTTVCPGLMRTGSPPRASFKGRHRREYAWFGLSGALPLLSMGSTRAARRIVEACRRGQPELILTFPAKLAARAQGLFPGLTARVLGAAGRLLPEADGVGKEARTGSESESFLTRSFLTALSRRAAARNNERPLPAPSAPLPRRPARSSRPGPSSGSPPRSRRRGRYSR